MRQPLFAVFWREPRGEVRSNISSSGSSCSEHYFYCFHFPACCEGEKSEKQSCYDSEFPRSECGWSYPCGHVFSFPPSYKWTLNPWASSGSGSPLSWDLISDLAGCSELDSEWVLGPSLSSPPIPHGESFPWHELVSRHGVMS